jgi:response regulator RpfG family c-di-GMP phosphodiesterase
MELMRTLVLEETEADLVHHQRILATIPGVGLGLFADPAAASKTFVDQKIDVLVVDDGIVGGGIAFLKQIHLLSGQRDVPTILLVGNGDKDARRAAYEYGVYNVIEKPIDPVSYLCIVRNALSIQVMRRNDATRAMAVVDQYKVLQAQIEEREIQVISALLYAANFADPGLSRRMIRVAGIASKIAHRVAAIAHDDAWRFGIAARVYDIGMLALPAPLRERRTELTGPDAARLLGPHVERSVELFAKDRSGLVDLAAVIAHQHHERFDGHGYPDGLERHDISIYAQLVLIAETFNDVTTGGAHGPGGHSVPLSEHQALAYIDRESGTAFDPEIIEGLRLTVESPLGESPVPANA